MKFRLKLAFIMTLALGASNYALAGSDAASSIKAQAPAQASEPASSAPAPVIKVETTAVAEREFKPDSSVEMPETELDFRNTYFNLNPDDFDPNNSCYAQINEFRSEEKALDWARSQMRAHPGLYLHVYTPQITANTTVMIAGNVSMALAKEAMTLAYRFNLIKGVTKKSCRLHCINSDGHMFGCSI